MSLRRDLRIRVLVVVLACATSACAAWRTDPAAKAAPLEELIVWAEADPDEGQAPLSVELFCEPLEDIDQPQYSWDPGDGSDRLEGQQVKHTYRRPGTFKARVAVRDKAGNLGEDEVQIDVEIPVDVEPAD